MFFFFLVLLVRSFQPTVQTTVSSEIRNSEIQQPADKIDANGPLPAVVTIEIASVVLKSTPNVEIVTDERVKRTATLRDRLNKHRSQMQANTAGNMTAGTIDHEIQKGAAGV